MLAVTSGLELFSNRRDRTERKENGMWICIQLPFNKKSSWKLQLKNQVLFTLTLPEIMQTSTFMIKISETCT